jgi:hypothetical protein
MGPNALAAHGPWRLTVEQTIGGREEALVVTNYGQGSSSDKNRYSRLTNVDKQSRGAGDGAPLPFSLAQHPSSVRPPTAPHPLFADGKAGQRIQMHNNGDKVYDEKHGRVRMDRLQSLPAAAAAAPLQGRVVYKSAQYAVPTRLSIPGFRDLLNDATGKHPALIDTLNATIAGYVGLSDLPIVSLDSERLQWCIVKMVVPPEAKTVMPIHSTYFQTYRKHRTNMARVIDLQFALYDKEIPLEWGAVKRCLSGVHNGTKLVYTVGEMVYPDSFDPNPNDDCSNGIHYHEERHHAFYWIARHADAVHTIASDAVLADAAAASGPSVALIPNPIPCNYTPTQVVHGGTNTLAAATGPIGTAVAVAVGGHNAAAGIARIQAVAAPAASAPATAAGRAQKEGAVVIEPSSR